MSLDKNWWRGAVIYQIYPWSFQDSDGDGIGNLAGIERRLDYVASLGVDAIWLSPFFKSPMADFGYDVSDYRDVDPIFGSLADFDSLTKAAHARGLKMVIDLVISHTSDKHPWFEKSRQNRDNEYADWYVWVDPKPDGSPPNNWLSVFGGCAWEWEARRRQYYLHNFLKSQPDLDFHNPKVREAMIDVFRFWIEHGVDGFRLDTVNFYYHDAQLRNNPPRPTSKVVTTAPLANPYTFQDHVYDKTRPENLSFLEALRAELDKYPAKMTLGELGIEDDGGVTMGQYTSGNRLNMAYSFEFMLPTFTAAHVRNTVEAAEKHIGGGWICWAFSNHDNVRSLSRYKLDDDPDRGAAFTAALLTSLRGSACLFEGEELGLSQADVPFERIRDPYGIPFWPEYKGRDGCRTPMPWEKDAPNAGFTTGEPWLPIPDDQKRRAPDGQNGRLGSALERCRKFLKWRQGQPVLKEGDIWFYDAPEPVVMFTRETAEGRILAAFNMGRSEARCVVPIRVDPMAGHGFTGRLDGSYLVLPGLDAFFGRCLS